MTEGRKTLPRIQKIEKRKLDTLVGVGSKSVRLACQTLMGEQAVTIGVAELRLIIGTPWRAFTVGAAD